MNYNEEDFEYDGRMQGFPGQVYSKKPNGNWVIVGKILIWVIWGAAFIAIICL